MRYTIRYSSLFKKSYKKCMKRGCDKQIFWDVISTLGETGTLPVQYKPHKLKGRYKGYWECHLTPDWLLIWQQNDMQLTLVLIDTGSHSDLF